MKVKITVEIQEPVPKIDKNRLGEDVWILWGLDVYSQEQYWIIAQHEVFSDIQPGDIWTFWGNVEGLKAKSFYAEKAELVVRYPRKIKDVLGMEP
jgi:hypothetical protein